ncbi:uncharacterized protein LOC132736156, partial [Ruditapes philippinarum]|uniref:uncharacterized protein LOC132736156 n=1 Tax=Ruditapes philippinarum TaxID=129788 RepID=UPI00295C0E68
PPSQPRIMNDSFPFLEGQTGKSIYCTSSDYGNPLATATWTAQYGTPDSADTRKLTLPNLTYQVDRSPVKCQLKNLYTQRKSLQIQSKQLLLQVEYSPRIQILVESKQVNTTTKHEGQTLSATCIATGNPNPVVNWVRQPSRGPTLSFDDIGRTDHGKYTCRAIATSTHYPSHNFVTEEEFNVIVNYGQGGCDVGQDLLQNIYERLIQMGNRTATSASPLDNQVSMQTFARSLQTLTSSIEAMKQDITEIKSGAPANQSAECAAKRPRRDPSRDSSEWWDIDDHFLDSEETSDEISPELAQLTNKILRSRPKEEQSKSLTTKH